MSDFEQAFALALRLLFSFDPALIEIVALSLKVSLSALFLAGLIGLPFGAAVAVTRFPGRGGVIILLNAMMGLPPVVIGLLVYMLLSRAGPLGVLGLLYTPAAMIIAQTILIAPIIAALTWQVVESLEGEYSELFRSMRVPFHRRVPTLLFDARFSLMTVMLAGFGRAVAEVGAVMIVGGNIDHLTRVMTTAIALETAKGDLAQALALGFVLVLIAITVNGAVIVIRQAARRRAYA
ncbi:MAG: ABC transporter permease [Rhodobiaceae bacterium]|nr:ABC transporter permease [Rhodobiaceae bacterium]MCC0055643.1 ABC transporter permease [Rhodobiaceae bacterium]